MTKNSKVHLTRKKKLNTDYFFVLACGIISCIKFCLGEKVGYLFATGFFIWVSVFVSFLASVVSVSSSFYAIKDGEYNGMKILSVILAVLFGVLGIHVKGFYIFT